MALVACDPPPTPAGESASTSQRPSVTIIASSPGGWTESFVAYGVVEPATSVQIIAPLAGRIEEVLVEKGTAVKAGQELVRFDERTRSTYLGQTKAASAAAKRAVGDARRELDDKKALGRAGTIPRAEVETAEVTLRQAVERYEDARSTVRLASRDLADMKLESPVAGTVTARSIEPGELVTAGRELFTIVTTDRLRVKTFVSEVHVNALAVGATIPVRVNGVRGAVLMGRIESVALRADDATGNFEVLVALVDTGGLVRPGMTAEVELETIPDPDVIVIPRAAIVERERRRVVFVEREGVATELQAVFGIGSDAFVPVIEGLEPGDHVIIDGLAFVQGGVPVDATLVDDPRGSNTPESREGTGSDGPPDPAGTTSDSSEAL